MNKERLIKEAEAFADHIAHHAYEWAQAAENNADNVEDHKWATMSSIVSLLENLWGEISEGEEEPKVLEEARNKARAVRQRRILDEIVESFS